MFDGGEGRSAWGAMGDAGGASDGSGGAPPREESARWDGRAGQAVLPQARQLRVLVVDDDEDFRHGLGALVASLGNSCERARDGDEARSALLARDFDVVISDWSMPGGGGLELCRWVRARDERHYTYFIFATALADRAHMLEGMRAGADDFLPKPVDPDEVEARLILATRVTALHRRVAERTRRLRRDSQNAMHLARVDALTGVANRFAMQQDLAALADAPARRYCAALLDLDFFKHYNDHYGHLAGDAALRAVAQAARDALRAGDALYRYGGEEFLVLLPDLSVPEAVRAMDRVRAAVEALALPHAPSAGAGTVNVLTVSVGVAERAEGDRTPPDAWIARADSALYAAKKAGRNRVITAE